MQLRELLEVAGLLSVHGRSLLASTTRLNDEAVGAYWAASRCRLDRWGYSLRAYGNSVRSSANEYAVRLAPLAEEIVVSEVLTRCVAALFLAHDTHHHRRESAPVGRIIVSGHREAVDRLNAVTAAWWSHESHRSRTLVSLKDRCERWTDMLIANLQGSSGLHEFAFDPQRMRDFADTCANQQSKRHESCCAGLVMAGLSAAFRDLHGTSPNGDLHTQISGAALGCFGPEAFDSFGLLRSTWIDRLQRLIDETIVMVTDDCGDATSI